MLFSLQRESYEKNQDKEDVHTQFIELVDFVHGTNCGEAPHK